MRKFFKLIYSRIPLKRELFIFLRKIWIPPHSLYMHLHFKDKFKVQISPKESFWIMHYGDEIENEIFWNGFKGGWEKVSLGLWADLCQDAGVILDIGANTGIYSLTAKAINPAAEVLAFEPVERIFKKLVRNCELNGYKIQCYDKAASNYTGKAVIYDTLGEHIMSVTVNKNIHAPSMTVKECEIQTVTLKDIILEKQLKRIDLVKIDVETHEPEVLEGFGEYLEKFRPTIFIEVLEDEIGAKINRLVAGLDYLYFNIDEDKGVRQVESIGRSDYYNYLLCSKEDAKKINLL